MSDLNIGELLADQLDKLLSAEVNAESLAILEAGDSQSKVQLLWQKIEEMGIADVMRTGADDAGLGWLDCAELIRVLGRHAAPIPLVETLLGRRLLSAAGLAIPEGALAMVEADITLDAAGCLQGSAEMVSWAEGATQLIGVAQQGATQYLYCISGADALERAEKLESLERAPTSAINLFGLKPLSLAPMAASFSMRAQLAVVRALMISGACDKAVDLAVEYANTRKQFGKPIGKFQALQHQLAEASCRAAAAEMAAKYACRELDNNHDGEQWLSGVATAKYMASIAAKEVSRIAHQVFGAIGITDEHELHYFTRRLWQWRVDAGNERYWSEQLGNQVLEAGSAQLWPSLTC